jgi:hypothetical protein
MMWYTPNPQSYKGYTDGDAPDGFYPGVMHIARTLCAVVRKLWRDRTAEAYPCREKWREISRRFSDFWMRNVLLTANLCDNGTFLGDDRPHDGGGMV